MRPSVVRLVGVLGRGGLACVAALAAAGCPAGRDATDVTPAIRVAPGAAARWGATLGRAPIQPTGAPPGPARVHAMRPGEALGGPNAIGRPGDLVLENDQVVFVVDQLGSGTGFAESGGNVVDAADARARRDELGQIFTFFGTFPRQAVYAALASGVTPDGAAWIEARGPELRQPSLVVTTRYTLRPPDRALLIETTVENTGASPAELPALGDAIQWGGAEKVAPGKPRGFKGASTGPYVGGVGRFTSYAMTSTEGTIAAQSGSSWTDTAQREHVTIGPHESARYARVFLVGERADTSSLVGELAQAAGASVGELRVGLPEGTALPTGAVVTVRAAGSGDALTLAPPFAATLPVGEYSVAMLGMLATSDAPATAGATATAPDDADADADQERAKTVEVSGGAETRVELSVPPAATLEVRCVGPDGPPVPCKVTFAGSGATPSPEFGPGHAAGPARNQATSADGTTRVALAPGAYTVTASRGPEYALASVDVRLEPGAARSETLALRRVVDTRGYVACDFHQHTMASADAPVTAHDRVIANAAEGVEAAVASEHNAVVDLEPIVRELHLERDLVEIAGDELTSDADGHPWGHANVFPMRLDPSRANGGSPPLRGRPGAADGDRADLTPASIFAWVRANVPGEHVVQVNHPRSGNNGYFDLLGFDRTRGAGTSPAYDGSFDAVEVWNGRNVAARARVIDDWRALLRTGHPVTPTANTDTHGIVGQEAGYPRTLVRVADDAHLDAWDAARTANLVHGVKELRDVVITNGPMLRVTANGAPVGGVARGPVVTVRVHVECAPWVDVDAVRVLRASGAETTSDGDPAPRPVTLAPLPSGARGADLTFAVRVDADDALFVVATGRRPLAPVLGGDESELRPWAMTGAIWVDADGDGRALGR